MYKGLKWVSYDNVESIRMKTQFAYDRKLAGVMTWSIDTDDFGGRCGGPRFPLLRTINNALYKRSKGIADRVTPTNIQSKIASRQRRGSGKSALLHVISHTKFYVRCLIVVCFVRFRWSGWRGFGRSSRSIWRRRLVRHFHRNSREANVNNKIAVISVVTRNKIRPCHFYSARSSSTRRMLLKRHKNFIRTRPKESADIKALKTIFFFFSEE